MPKAGVEFDAGEKIRGAREAAQMVRGLNQYQIPALFLISRGDFGDHDHPAAAQPFGNFPVAVR